MPTPRSSPSETRFRRRSETELDPMDAQELLRHIAAAKRSKDLSQARTATHMLLYKYERFIRRRVALRLPEHLMHHQDTVATWVLKKLMDSALKLTLKGESVGEWVNWYGTAVDRQVISFFRTTEGKALERETRLPSEHEGDEGAPPDHVATGLDAERIIAQACYAGLVQEVLDQLLNPMHVAVVRAAFFDDQASTDIALIHGTTAANVDQIKSRFKKALRALCQQRGVTGE
jgi:DNA-directed RNA polymerase specialized sigma24 family protein